MKRYVVRTSCEVAGRWREAGETVPMTEEQARYLVAPFGEVLIDPDAATETVIEPQSPDEPAVELLADPVVQPPAEEAQVEETPSRGRIDRA